MKEITIILEGNSSRMDKVVKDVQRTLMRSAGRNRVDIKQLSKKTKRGGREIEIPGFLVSKGI